MAILKLHLIILIALLLSGFAGASQASSVTIDPALQEQFADSLYEQGQYRRAAEEYQRFAFFFSEHPKQREMLLKAGQSFLLAKDPVLALKLFKPLTDTFTLDTIAIEAFFQSSQSYLQMNAYTQAVVQLSNLVALSDDPAIKDRAYYQIAWIHIERMDWVGAKRALDQITVDGRRRHQSDTILQALDQVKQIPQKDPRLAGVLSILPGAGQLYSHRYKDALVAFILTVGTFWAAHEAFENDQVVLGGLLGLVGAGFYAGNFYGAANGARKYNRIQKRSFINQLKQDPVRSDLPSPHHRSALLVGLRVSF